MSTYYETLNIAPSANDAEVQVACDTIYNKWRPLVNHHSQEVVNKANEALQTLETIRSTLSDPGKRAVYNAAIGLSGPMGALADPEALLQSAPYAPILPGAMRTPPAPAPAPSQETSRPVAPPRSVWACAKCETDNPPQTQFCFKCGAQLVRRCPECGNDTSLISTGMCGKCGYDYDTATYRQQLAGEISECRKQLEEWKAKPYPNGGGGNIVWGIVIILGGLLFVGNSVFWFLGGLVIGGLAISSGVKSNNARNTEIAKITNTIAQLKEQDSKLTQAFAGTIIQRA